MIYPIIALMASSFLVTFQNFDWTFVNLKVTFRFDIKDQLLVKWFELDQGFLGPAFKG
ncbi:hypothetical protein D3C87_1791680 [compost metagenome]